MSNKFITTQIRLACLSGPPFIAKTIWQELEETIAQRKIILEIWENIQQAEELLSLFNSVEKPGYQSFTATRTSLGYK
jgi:c-di-GMP-related signal transduction protein